MAGQLTLAELRAEAEAMGLEGGDIVNFEYKQQEMHRDERAEERVARSVVDEAEREIEHEVRAADALEREKVREHEIRVVELTNSTDNFDQSMADAAMRPKLPVFKDGDDIVSFIIRLERIAAWLKLTPESYAV